MTGAELNEFFYAKDGLACCGCGCPDDVAALVRDVLRVIAEDAPTDHAAFSIWWDGHDARMVALLPSDGVRYLCFYFLIAQD